MKIFIDSEFRCHISYDGTMTEVETDFFDGKCDAFVEGYRFIPKGESWKQSDGVVFTGEMISPWKPYSELDSVQREYERQLLAEQAAELEDMRSALKKLGVILDE